jgi:AcrR family transcriptional regulator
MVQPQIVRTLCDHRPDQEIPGRGEDTVCPSENALLAAAGRVLKDVGYARASVARIAREAQRAHGTFYLYFSNKEDIYEALLQQIWDDLHDQSRAIWRNDHPIESVHETVRRYVLSYRDNVDLWQLLMDMSATNPKFRTIRDERRRAFVRRIERGLERSRSHADLGPMRTDILAELLAGMVDDICATTFLHGRDLDLAEVVDHITTVWARAVGYVQPADHDGPVAPRRGRQMSSSTRAIEGNLRGRGNGNDALG